MACLRCGGVHGQISCDAGALLNDEIVARRFSGGTVYKNSGHSHVTVDAGTAHITIEVPGLSVGQPVKLRVEVPKDGF